MSVTIFPIKAFKDNYIWTWFDEVSRNAWVVDPGEAQSVINVLNKNGFSLAGILLTHHHYDHSGGIKELLQHWKNIPVFGSYRSTIKEINHPLRENDEIVCSPFRLKVIEIPGHTLDHIAYYNDKILFCGDTLFSAGCGRVFEGTIPQMYQSLNKLAKLSQSILVYSAHEYTQANLQFAKLVEPNNLDVAAKLLEVNRLCAVQKPTLPSVMREELRFNPFLRCDVPEVISAVEKQTDSKLNNSVEVFEKLRSWKNTI